MVLRLSCMLVEFADSEDPKLIRREIIFEVYSNICELNRHTGGRSSGLAKLPTAQAIYVVLCLKLYHAAKTEITLLRLEVCTVYSN